MGRRTSAQRMPEVLAVLQPLVDNIIYCNDEFIESVGGEKGGSEGVERVEALGEIIRSSGKKPEIVPGGSASNSIKALASLGHSCAVAGTIGDDSVGTIYSDTMASYGVLPVLETVPVATGQVLCMVTPDGQRTMRTFLGASLELEVSQIQPQMFEGAKIVLVEAYMLYNGSLIRHILRLAQSAEAKVSMDLASFELVRHFGPELISLLEQYVDIVFCNVDEALELTQENDVEKAVDVISSFCDTVVVTMGSKGCWAKQKETKVWSAAVRLPAAPKDTTGAGDVFAAGFLHGILVGCPLLECAQLGATTASAVINVCGAQPTEEGWGKVREDIKAGHHGQLESREVSVPRQASPQALR